MNGLNDAIIYIMEYYSAIKKKVRSSRCGSVVNKSD